MTQIGDIITDKDDLLYADTAIWCNENNATLEEIEPEGNIRRFKVVAVVYTLAEKNEAIRQQRQVRFTSEADPIRYDYEEALALGTSNAEELKQTWLAKKAQIREELPYIEG